MKATQSQEGNHLLLSQPGGSIASTNEDSNLSPRLHGAGLYCTSSSPWTLLYLLVSMVAGLYCSSLPPSLTPGGGCRLTLLSSLPPSLSPSLQVGAVG
ncbi:unnamed protein product [Boreogadus saida]